MLYGHSHKLFYMRELRVTNVQLEDVEELLDVRVEGGFMMFGSDWKSLKAELSPVPLAPLSAHVDDRTSVRLYQDSRPWCLEVAPLQKGLVLLFNGAELIGEGMGFGVPVVKYRNKTYFSSTAECSIHETEKGDCVIKRFVLDTISHKRLGKASYVNDRLYRLFHRVFERAYLGYGDLFPFFDKAMEFRRLLGIHTEFTRVKPKGTIAVKYSIKPEFIRVQVDLSGFEKSDCEEIIILNEQGSTFFSHYSDSEGLRLRNARIGAWTR